MAEERGEDRARRGKHREGRGLVSVLLGTALLGVLGFGLGVVAGLVLEEPGLLLDYVTGRTTAAPIEERIEEPAPFVADAPVPAEAPPAPVEVQAPSVGAAPQDAAEPPPAAEAIEVASAPVASPPPIAVPSPPPAESPPAPAHAEQSGYAVQVGALGDSASAEQLAAKLEKQGFAVYVTPSAEPGIQRWRVRVGPVATREEAQQLAARLEREKLPTWVLAEGRR